MHGDNGTNVTVSVGLVANPPITTNYTWTMNGKKLSNASNVTVMPGELHFAPLLVSAHGNYSVRDCNNISCSSRNFSLDVYCKLWAWLHGTWLGVVTRGVARCGSRGGCLGYKDKEIVIHVVMVGREE